MNTHIPDATLIREGRAIYFQTQNIPPDGGYNDAWVPAQLGPVSFSFPNTPGRLRAVRFHDIHHVLTGYGTDHTGESEIAAFEIGGGCGRHTAAWVLNLFAMVMGLWNEPGRLLPAFVRGRRSGNLYHQAWDEALLDQRVGELRARVHLDEQTAPPTLTEKLAFAGWMSVALTMVFGWVGVIVALVIWKI